MIWLGLFNESLSLLFIYTRQSNTVNSNLYVYLEYLLILWQFYNWNSFNKKTFCLLIIGGLAIWLTDDFVLHAITRNNSLFRVVASFVLVFLSIDQINKIIIFERSVLRHNGGNGIEAIREIYLSGITRIIAISTYDTDQLIIDALQAGALGYIVKNADRNEITDAIKKVYRFEKYYCKFTSTKLIRSIHKITFKHNTKEKPDLLSEKEKEIIRLICQGKTSEEIGGKLFMSKRTVEGFRARILVKVNEKTLQGLVIYAIKNNIFIIGSADDYVPPE